MLAKRRKLVGLNPESHTAGCHRWTNLLTWVQSQLGNRQVNYANSLIKIWSVEGNCKLFRASSAGQ